MKNIAVRMDRPHLEDLPDKTVPAPYDFRWYQAGDEEAWVRIHERADDYNEASLQLFRDQFGDDAARLSERQGYLLDPEGAPVGTASAWRDPNDPENWGRVHWVAIVPTHQGKKLSRPLMGQILQRLQELGHEKTYLMTNTDRLPAIHLYLKLGFRPAVRSDEERAGWEAVGRALGRDDLLAEG